MPQPQATAILLLAHGTPNALGEMAEYLAKVTGGRALPPEVVTELQHRYAQIGLGDQPGPEPPPLAKWTLAQGRLLEARLLEAALATAEQPLPVYVAMRNWHPFIVDVVQQMRADGITRVLAICLAPQNSRTSTGLYRRALMTAVDGQSDTHKIDVTFVDEWPEEPALIEAFARRLAAIYPRACAEAAPDQAHEAGVKNSPLPILFTAHSVPERTLAATADHPADPYADQARRTAALAFAKAAELLGDSAPREYLFAFQSQGVAGGPGGPWIGPTVEDTLAALAAEGHRGVVLQPIGFVCDHVEVLYDIDIAFTQTARSLNLRLFRPESLNDSPLLTDALADIVAKRLPR
jgi:ferrochelatase